MEDAPLRLNDAPPEPPEMLPMRNDRLGGRNGRPDGLALRQGDPLLAPARDRNLVAVHLRNGIDEGRVVNQNTFILDRGLLFAFLPRARDAVQRGILDLDAFVRQAVADEHPERLIRWALRFVFGHLERLHLVGEMDMFGAAEQQVLNSLYPITKVEEWGECMHAVCVVLDQDRSLGCSNELLGFVMGFMEILLPYVQNLLGPRPTRVLFEAFAGVFRGTRRDMVEHLHRIWDNFDPEIQEDLMRGMRIALPRENYEGRAHRIYLALQR
ncbi:hypothetical protein G7Z17_g8744 [Cylindrodendrum hubeiense]|uniref:Uncharacterized protein n=1 Tax=Cylindrodendrum hubeiense TaxID=595255 RepID=A0A9P5H933_9HYPO|nr:hypothetical protein G7Z17_g8744 [Cylindrodendrum hubeiense]